MMYLPEELSSLSLRRSPSWRKWSKAQLGWKSSSNLEEVDKDTLNIRHTKKPRNQHIFEDMICR